MTDKYEEFKEWFKKKSHCYGVWKIDDNGNQEICHYSRAFIDFEEEQAEKEKEREIKHIITEIIVRTPLEKVPKYKTGEDVDLYCSDVVTNKIYNALKEKDLIK